MVDKNEIPPQKQEIDNYLLKLYNQAQLGSDDRKIIEKSLDRSDHTVQDQIYHTFAISDYFNMLWQKEDLQAHEREIALSHVERINLGFKNEILDGSIAIREEPTNLDELIPHIKLSQFEEYNMLEKFKEIANKRVFELERRLHSSNKINLDIMRALNKPFYSTASLQQPQTDREVFHYSQGAFNEEENERIKRERAKLFVNKIQTQKQIQKLKFKAIEDQKNYELEQQLSAYERQKQEENERKKIEKLSKIQEHIKENDEKMRARKEEKERIDREIASIKAKKYKYQEVYEKGRSIDQETNSMRLAILQQNRQSHKPLDKEEFRQWEVDYQAKKELVMNRRKQNSQFNGERSGSVQEKPSFFSPFHNKFPQEFQLARKYKEEEKEKAKKVRERQLHFAKSEVKLPPIDPKKSQAVKELMLKFKSPRSQQIKKNKKPYKSFSKDNSNNEEDDDDYDPYKKGIGYLKQLRDSSKPRKKLGLKGSASDAQEVDHQTTVTSMKSETLNNRKKIYMQELRKRGVFSDVSRANEIEKILEDPELDPQVKKELLAIEAEKYDEKARRKETLSKYLTDKKKKELDWIVDEDGEVDKLYINSIKAKLQVLGGDSNNI